MKTAYHFEEGDPVREAREPQPYSAEDLKVVSRPDVLAHLKDEPIVQRLLATIEKKQETNRVLAEEQMRLMNVLTDACNKVEARDEALREAREALPDYAHPSLDAKRSYQVARVGVILDAALGDEDAIAALQRKYDPQVEPVRENNRRRGD